MEQNTWTSWNAKIQHIYNEKISPTNEIELAAAIGNAQKARIIGTGRSSADIIAGTSTLIDQSQLNRVLDIATDGTVTAQAGILLSDLIRAMEQAGRCLPALPDIDCITLGGALATGTHGTGRVAQSLSDYLTACRLVKADGNIVEINEATIPNLPPLDAVRVSLGLLGAFSTISLKTEPLFQLAVDERAIADDKWLQNWPDWLQTHDFLRILWLPHTGSGWVMRGDRYENAAPFPPKTAPSWHKHRRNLSARLYRDSWKKPDNTIWANRLLKTLFFSGNIRRTGTLYDTTVTKSRGSTLELAEWTIPFSRFNNCFEELNIRLNQQGSNARAHIPMDIRFIRKSSAWLGNACEADTVTVGCVSRTPEYADHYAAFKLMEEVFLMHGGRPHWAKRFQAEREILQKMYPRWADFIALRRQLDPTDKFLNTWLGKRFA